MFIHTHKTKVVLLFSFLVVFLLFSVVYTIGIGSTDIPLSTVYGILRDKIVNGGRAIEAGIYSTPHYQIIWNIRLPRVIFGVLCGMGLAMCGAVMQALVLNPIADPYILGISSGASAGAAWALLMPMPFFAGQYQVTFTAMIGALLSTFLVYTMAKAGGRGKLQPIAMILSGTAVNAVMSAVTSLLIFMAKSHESISAVYNWQMGSLASAQWNTIYIPFAGVAAGFIIFSASGKNLNIVMMGDEDAMALGINLKNFRTFMFIICSLVVSSLVSVTGIIGFVGLIIPHIIRLIIKSSNNIIIIPLSAFAGSVYMVWTDAIARSLFGTAELPLGIITAFIGAPFFLYLMIKRNYGGDDK